MLYVTQGWGVSRTNGDYFYPYTGHRSLNDTNNSPLNTIAAIREFQNRSAYDTEVDFIFLSQLWDIERFAVRICMYFCINKLHVDLLLTYIFPLYRIDIQELRRQEIY